MISILNVVPVLWLPWCTLVDAFTQLYSFGQIVSVRLQTVCTNFQTINGYSAIKLFNGKNNWGTQAVSFG